MIQIYLIGLFVWGILTAFAGGAAYFDFRATRSVSDARVTKVFIICFFMTPIWPLALVVGTVVGLVGLILKFISILKEINNATL